MQAQGTDIFTTMGPEGCDEAFLVLKSNRAFAAVAAVRLRCCKGPPDLLTTAY